MKLHNILALPIGPIMDEEIQECINILTGDVSDPKPYSSNLDAALDLRQLLNTICVEVNLTKLATMPAGFDEYCRITELDDSGKRKVSVVGSTIPEALGRTFLLYHYEYYGEHLPVSYQEMMQMTNGNNLIH